MDTNELLAHLHKRFAGRTFVAVDVAASLGGVLREVRLALNRLLRAGHLERVGPNGKLRLVGMPATPAPTASGQGLAPQAQESMLEAERDRARARCAELEDELQKVREDAEFQRHGLEGDVDLLRESLEERGQEVQTLREQLDQQSERAQQLSVLLEDAEKKLADARLKVQETLAQSQAATAELATSRTILHRFLVPQQKDVVVELGSSGPPGSVYLPEMKRFCWLPEMPGQRPSVLTKLTFPNGRGASGAAGPEVPRPARGQSPEKPKPAPDAERVARVLGFWRARPHAWLKTTQAAIELGLTSRQIRPVVHFLVEQGQLDTRGNYYRLSAAEAKTLPPPQEKAAPPEAPRAKPAPAQPVARSAPAIKAKPASRAKATRPTPPPKPAPPPASVPLVPAKPARPQASLTEAILCTLREAGRPLSRSLLLSRVVHPNRAGFDTALDELVQGGQVVQQENRYLLAGGSA